MIGEIFGAAGATASDWEPMPSFNERAYRDAMASYAAGVSVIAADDGVRAHALTASSFTSVSLKPPLLLVCVNQTSDFVAVVRRAGRFSLNILRESQSELGKLFATAPQADRVGALRRYAFEPPRLDHPEGPLVRFDCALHAEHAAGDHLILIGAPSALERDPGGRPLLWWRGRLGPAPEERPA